MKWFIFLLSICLAACAGLSTPVPQSASGGGGAGSPFVQQGHPSSRWAEFRLSGQGGLAGIAPGPDGGMWFLKNDADAVARFDVISGSVATYPLPHPSSFPHEIVAGPDGAMWFVETGGKRIGRISTIGAISEYPIPDGGAPLSICSGPDGNLWFVEAGGSPPGEIGSVSTTGTFHRYPIPDGHQGFFITSGPDGDLWFTEVNNDRVAKITTSGVITEYQLPEPNGSPPPLKAPFGIVSLGGVIWFTEYFASAIASVTTDGNFTEYPIGAAWPSGLAVGPGGFLWFIYDNSGSELGLFNPGTAKSTLYGSAPKTCCYGGVVAGPDGNMWLTGEKQNTLPNDPKIIVRVLDVMKTSPQSVTVTVGASQDFSVTEKVYKGTW